MYEDGCLLEIYLSRSWHLYIFIITVVRLSLPAREFVLMVFQSNRRLSSIRAPGGELINPKIRSLMNGFASWPS